MKVGDRLLWIDRDNDLYVSICVTELRDSEIIGTSTDGRDNNMEMRWDPKGLREGQIVQAVRCTECRGRGWHVGECHPQETCGL